MFDKDLCAICHKNPPAVFVTKFDEHGHQSNEGICLMCAKKMGIQPVNQMLDRFGLDDDALDNLNNEMHDMMEYISKPTSDENEEDLPEPDEEQESRLDAPNLFEMLKNFPITAKKEDTEEGDSSSNTTADPKTEKGKKDKKKGKKKYLDLYGQNLNDKASAGKLDNVIGRDREIDRVIQILNRRTKNNPVLIGEPGVGKTAIAEGLAEKIVNNQIPYKLLNKQVYLLDLTAMVAGTQFRGQFEMRMKGVIDEAKESGNVILVIDEIHNIMGAGEAEGAMNAANILKPALSRGEIQVIGATTLNEYRKYIEKDGALERRFQPVYVNEPTIEETVEILQGLKHYYEDFHKVRISDSIIKDTVKMSERYITDRFLPDKAID
ncbi:MAG: AAA family ATPase, partial [Clostridiales bacterium]|nr:AAA family ATPase [Clostridiales bacterium]